MQLYPGWTARDNYASNAKKKKKKREKREKKEGKKGTKGGLVLFMYDLSRKRAKKWISTRDFCFWAMF